MRVLAIESSCDETAAAVYDDAAGLLAHALYSQVAMHAEYGGVVPELASRDHVRKLLPLVREVMAQAQTTPQQLDGVAWTAGPGLAGALLVGASVGAALAWTWGLPGLAVHHMEGHLLAPLLEEPAPEFPFVALLVSGGHTQLVEVRGPGDYRLLGESLDDAAGEAFDKTAKLLGLGYPGGPALARLAEQGQAGRFTFPRPMTDRPGLDFSFSGLKTAVLTAVQKHPQESERADIALAFEEAVVETLAIKCRRALGETALRRLVVAGGVSANRRLRARLGQLAGEDGFEVFWARLEFCTDNAAMIALAGAMRLAAGGGKAPRIDVRARWPLVELKPMTR